MIPLIVNHRNSIQSIKRLTIRYYTVVQLTNLEDIHLSTVALWNVTLSVPGTFLTCPLLIMLRKCDVIKDLIKGQLWQPNLINLICQMTFGFLHDLLLNCKKIARKLHENAKFGYKKLCPKVYWRPSISS